MSKVVTEKMTKLKSCVLFLLVATVNANDCRTIEFLPEIHGMFLENHMIRSMKVERMTACEAECFQEPNCVSFNYGPINSDTPACNLNNRTHFQASVGDFLTKDNYIYRYIVNPCQSNPCPSGFTCQVGFTYKGYRCICPQGAFGLQCESSSSSSSSSSSLAATPTPDLSWPAITSTPALLSISATPSAPPSPLSTTTPDQFIPGTGSLVGSFYKLFTEHETWNNAEAKCKSHGAELVNIESAEENEFLTMTFLTASTVTYWIGLSDQVEEGKWMWTDGSPLADYINWGNDNPNDLSGNQNCGQIVKGSFQMGGFNFNGYNDGEWNDFRCDYPLGYICEKVI